jgi:hypothetical protein
MSAQIALKLDQRLFDQLPSPDEPSWELPETTANEDLLAEEDEYEPASYEEPRPIHVPRLVVWAILILFGLTVIAVGMWGFARSTLTYGMVPVDSTTNARLTQIHAKLAAAGALEAALRHLAMAAQPGINIGDAIEALADTDKSLEPMSDNSTVASAQQEIRTIRDDLISRRYRYGETRPSTVITPLPTLAIP